MQLVVAGVQNWSQEMKGMSQVLADAMKAAWTETTIQWLAGVHELKEETAQSFARQKDLVDKLTGDTAALRAEAADLRNDAQQVLAGAKAFIEAEQNEVVKVLQVERETLEASVQKQHDMVQRYVGAFDRLSGRFAEVSEQLIKLERDRTSERVLAVMGEVGRALTALDPSVKKLSEGIKVEVGLVAGIATVTTK
jgi:hypothetical protein